MISMGFKHHVGRALALLAVFLCLGSPSLAAKRIALVVGNNSYWRIEKLHKSRADARAYASVLRQKGFAVQEGYDLTSAGLDGAVSRFASSLRPDDVALFFYSGHGWSDGSQNYVLGVDASAADTQSALTRISKSLRNGTDGILDRIERSGAGLRIVILDTCVDSPFSRGGGRSSGLVGMSWLPAGTFVVYSAGAGQGAIDQLSSTDSNPNSLFTRVFVPLLRSDISLQEAVRASQWQVSELARGVGSQQDPWYWDGAAGPICLSGKCGQGDSRGATSVFDASIGPRMARSR